MHEASDAELCVMLYYVMVCVCMCVLVYVVLLLQPVGGVTGPSTFPSLFLVCVAIMLSRFSGRSKNVISMLAGTRALICGATPKNKNKSSDYYEERERI